MARICANCGKELPDGMMFCTECGAKVTEPPKAEPVPQAPPVQPQPVYTPPPVQPQSAVQSEEKYVKTSTYFWLMFLFGVPVIGFIMTIIMAFAPKNKSLKNFAKAILIWVIVGLILSGIIALIFTLMGNSLMAYVGNISGLEGIALQ